MTKQISILDKLYSDLARANMTKEQRAQLHSARIAHKNELDNGTYNGPKLKKLCELRDKYAKLTQEQFKTFRATAQYLKMTEEQ